VVLGSVDAMMDVCVMRAGDSIKRKKCMYARSGKAVVGVCSGTRGCGELGDDAVAGALRLVVEAGRWGG
jgi:hypothetical protein